MPAQGCQPLRRAANASVFLLSAKNTAKKDKRKIWLPQIFAKKFTEHKKYIEYLQYFLQSLKITAKNIAKKLGKKYGYHKYLRYFLQSAKDIAYICGIFCGRQKIPLKISQN